MKDNVVYDWFQFPSNGKPYPKQVIVRALGGPQHQLFQFPSNGKPYPKCLLKVLFQVRLSVSIPFKRETISKVEQRYASSYYIRVSIPFKRETISKALHALREKRVLFYEFQFPSNGKPYPK